MSDASTPYQEQLKMDVYYRLQVVAGQVNGVANMLTQQRPLTEALQQLNAVQAGLRGASSSILALYMEQRVTQATDSREPVAYDEIMKTVFKFLR